MSANGTATYWQRPKVRSAVLFLAGDRLAQADQGKCRAVGCSVRMGGTETSNPGIFPSYAVWQCLNGPYERFFFFSNQFVIRLAIRSYPVGDFPTRCPHRANWTTTYSLDFSNTHGVYGCSHYSTFVRGCREEIIKVCIIICRKNFFFWFAIQVVSPDFA